MRSQKREHFGITALRSNGSLYTDSSSKSEILNKQFKSVFSPPSLDETPKLPGQPFPPIKDLRITEHSVCKLIDWINTSKSSGPDGIPGKLLQSLAKELAPVFDFSIRLSETGIGGSIGGKFVNHMIYAQIMLLFIISLSSSGLQSLLNICTD